MLADRLNEERLEHARTFCSLSQTGEQGSYTPVRERKREGEREKIKRGKEGGRERERKREMSRIVIIFKRNDGCLGTF
jgi:hypothetical protein